MQNRIISNLGKPPKLIHLENEVESEHFIELANKFDYDLFKSQHNNNTSVIYQPILKPIIEKETSSININTSESSIKNFFNIGSFAEHIMILMCISLTLAMGYQIYQKDQSQKDSYRVMIGLEYLYSTINYIMADEPTIRLSDINAQSLVSHKVLPTNKGDNFIYFKNNKIMSSKDNEIHIDIENSHEQPILKLTTTHISKDVCINLLINNKNDKYQYYINDAPIDSFMSCDKDNTVSITSH